MKKNILIIALFISALFSSLLAQEDEIRYGAKVGLNIASIKGDTFEGVSLSSRVGFHIGGVVEIPISDVFAIQPELLFSTQGAKSKDSDSDEFDEVVSFETITKLNYIQLPVMAKYYLSNVLEGLSLQGGIQAGFLLSAEAEASGGGDSSSVDVKDSFSAVDFGINLGGGYQHETGLFADIRYNLGLANILDTEGESSSFSQQNSVFQISIGYKF